MVPSARGGLVRATARRAIALAAASFACAAVVAGIRRGLLGSPVRVHVRGGTLTIAWDGEGRPVRMKGAASTVFEGRWTPPPA